MLYYVYCLLSFAIGSGASCKKEYCLPRKEHETAAGGGRPRDHLLPHEIMPLSCPSKCFPCGQLLAQKKMVVKKKKSLVQKKKKERYVNETLLHALSFMNVNVRASRQN